MPDSSSPSLIPAAQYLRMSKDHQNYSIRNQARAIAAYAAKNGLVVVKTYKDPGESGLTLRERPGLQALLADVLKPGRQFTRLLVYDVSRWGRFQNLDESGHYEFLCYAAAVPVSYCTETFDNDGSPLSSLLKQFKRFQAAEYSRELSEKVLFAQLLQARIGHKLGGNRRYGFERLLVDEHDRPIQRLEPGQTKALNNQRVVWAVGDSQEIAVIREIFRWYAFDGMTIPEIARVLNEKGVPSTGSSWTPLRVRNVLKNELLVGVHVFNRTSQRLKGARKANPPEAWIRTKVLEPVISCALFDRASRRLRNSQRLLPHGQVAAALARLLKARGYLTSNLIDSCPYTPSTKTLYRLYGSMQAAYGAVGYRSERWDRRPKTERVSSKEDVLAALRAVYEREGHVSEAMLNADPSLPAAALCRYHFGKLTNAYRLAGIPYDYAEFKRRGMARTKLQRAEQPPRRVTTPRWPTVDGRYSDFELLDHLRRLHTRHGYVTARLIRADPETPPTALFVHRFGSLTKSYKFAGIRPSNSSSWSREARVKQAPAFSQTP